MSTELVRELEACEVVIERGMQTFVEVGQALLKIRTERLYQKQHNTFEDYCRERWGMRHQRADELIRSASAMNAIAFTDTAVPTNEGQARELSRVPEPKRADVWKETLDRTDGKPTAKAIRETYEASKTPPTPPQTPVVEPTAVIPPEKGDAPDSPDKIMMDLMKQFIDIREKADKLTAAKMRGYKDQHRTWRKILGDHAVVIKTLTDRITEAS